MSTGADTHEPSPRPSGVGPEAWRGGAVVRLLPIAVLVLSPDRYFRAAATMLLSRRGCSVLSASDEAEALEATRLHAVDVLVVELQGSDDVRPRRARAVARSIDAVAAAAGRRVAEVGVVLVAESDELGEAAAAEPGTEHPALDKWGPFEQLYLAVADCDRARRLPFASGGSWPDSVRRPGAV
jgi:CheY-like chemotaxis protein